MDHLRFLFIEPFFGGSHRNFAEGLISHSRHKIDLLTLPARFWKWRMRGAALYFAKKIPSLNKYKGLITTDLMSLSDFKSLTGRSCPPTLVYFHENQLTYPVIHEKEYDYHFALSNMTTALAAKQNAANAATVISSATLEIPNRSARRSAVPYPTVVTTKRRQQ